MAHSMAFPNGSFKNSWNFSRSRIMGSRSFGDARGLSLIPSPVGELARNFYDSGKPFLEIQVPPTFTNKFMGLPVNGELIENVVQWGSWAWHEMGNSGSLPNPLALITRMAPARGACKRCNEIG
jgi:hypothetical protein